jgi:hypothetical protein
MVDYFPLIARAVAALDPNTRELRHVLYDRARKTLIDKLRVNDPTLALQYATPCRNNQTRFAKPMTRRRRVIEIGRR